IVAVTDQSGCVLFADLAAGPWLVSCDRAAVDDEGQRVEVAPGRTADVTLRSMRGIDAIVRVQDREGTGVPGAEVILWSASRYPDAPLYEAGQTIGTTDASGTLALRSLPYLGFRVNGSWLAARHPLLGTSPVQMLRPPADERDAEP